MSKVSAVSAEGGEALQPDGQWQKRPAVAY